MLFYGETMCIVLGGVGRDFIPGHLGVVVGIDVDSCRFSLWALCTSVYTCVFTHRCRYIFRWYFSVL